MIDRPGHDESRRELERALAAAGGGDERAAARVRIASSERRRGQLDLAALGLEDAIREGAPLDLAGAELAALLSEEPGDPGAFRALACFSAVPPPTPPEGPFPLARVSGAAAHAARKAALFRAAFRSLGSAATRRLAAAVAQLVPGPEGRHDPERWSAAFGRAVSADEASALDLLYARLLGSARARVTAHLDTPGPLREVASERIAIADARFAVALHGEQSAYVVRRVAGPRGPQLVLRDLAFFAGQWLHAEGSVLANAPEELDPHLVSAAGGAFVLGVAQDELHASFSVPPQRFDLSSARRRLGPGVQLAATCPCADGIAVFLDSAGRYFSISTRGRISRERRLGPGLEVVSAASADGASVTVLARATRECVLVRLDADLRVQGDPVPVPQLRSPRDARVEWPTPDLVLVIDPPDTAHAFGADDRRLAWTARLADALDDVKPVAAEALELLAFGAIESEYGQPLGDLGLARWTRDGLGRHGPTVRVETRPGAVVVTYAVATRGGSIVVAHREDDELVLHLVEPQPVPAKVPPDREWTYALEVPPSED